jgi:putative hydrolase of the HAD superfamily
MNLENIDTIIFDLGGVILNLDYQKTINAFQELGSTDFEEMYAQAQQNDLFDKYETGEISSQHFVNSLLPFVKERTSPNKVVHAWNAMILDFPLERLNLLDALKEKYSTYLLSNTNELHLQEVKKALKKVTDRNLESYFTKAYFSHEINLRKPNKEIFDFVCLENSLQPDRTLFIDDTIGHVNGSIQSGINGVHLTKDKTLESLFALK